MKPYCPDVEDYDRYIDDITEEGNTMTEPAINALGMSSIITNKLMSFGVIRKGKTGMADQIILSCLMTDIHKPDLKNEMGTYMHDHMNEEEKLLVHRMYTKTKDRVQEVDTLLSKEQL